jgi:hypothetical protein
MTVVSTEPIVLVLPSTLKLKFAGCFEGCPRRFRGSRGSLPWYRRKYKRPFRFQLTVFKVPS